jgi:hypothetical protein
MQITKIGTSAIPAGKFATDSNVESVNTILNKIINELKASQIIEVNL